MMVDFVLFFMIVLCAALLVFLLVRQYRLVKEFEQNKDHYSQQIHLFNSEYAAIQEHYISRSEEKYFTTKWQELYEEIKKYRLPKKAPFVSRGGSVQIRLLLADGYFSHRKRKLYVVGMRKTQSILFRY